ncbi:hypothetical protein C8R44DRAFT_877130 [Mycena epipterygia]|nr:hypothetical protein C8R44DRAFT_877130 [Mycena epipterygia]
MFPDAVLSLGRFVSLTHLELRLNHWPAGFKFRPLFSASPTLVSLRLTFVVYAAASCASEVRTIKPLAEALRFLPRLRTFALEKVYQAA